MVFRPCSTNLSLIQPTDATRKKKKDKVPEREQNKKETAKKHTKIWKEKEREIERKKKLLELRVKNKSHQQIFKAACTQPNKIMEIHKSFVNADAQLLPLILILILISIKLRINSALKYGEHRQGVYALFCLLFLACVCERVFAVHGILSASYDTLDSHGNFSQNVINLN